MTIMIIGGHRLHEGKVDAYLDLSKRLRELLEREGRGLLYWAINRSTSDPYVFGGITLWASPEDEQRMVSHPDRLALVAEFAPLFAERVAGVVGPVVMSLEPRKQDSSDTGSRPAFRPSCG